MDLFFGERRLQQVVDTICAIASDNGGKALLVGGCVRDALRRRSSKDIDIEVYGIAPDRLQSLLASRFPLDLVGKAFGILKLKGLPVEISVPRRESKSGTGHRGFHIAAEPFLSHREAASRRDFTINAMAFDPVENRLIDPFNGQEDLKEGRLRHTSDKFSEDPLRVLRAMQFAARFDFDVSEKTIKLCSGITPEGLPSERIFEEWKKLILHGVRPSRGLQFLRDCGWIRYTPELQALIDCPQEPEWHPEGDVWVHTLHCMDAFAQRKTGSEQEDLVVGLAVLCHDLGKPATTRFERGRLRSVDHEKQGEAPTRSFLSRLTNQGSLIEKVVPLVTHHLRPQQLFDAGSKDAAVRRLARNVGRIDLLVRVARADQEGRPGIDPGDFPAGKWLLERAEKLSVQDAAPPPVVMGRHLITEGLEPGPHFTKILDLCYEAQLDGEIATVEEGLALLRKKGILKPEER